MKKAIFKKAISTLTALSAMFAGMTATAQVYISNGGIEIQGVINTARSGDVVTVSVFKDGADWENEDFWKAENSESIVYCREGKLDSDRAYKFNFYLGDSGKYIVIIGNDEFESVKSESITYINKSKNDAALVRLSSAQTEDEIAGILLNSKSDLGLFDDFNNRLDFSSEAKIIKASSDGKELDYETSIKLINKACLAADINAKKTVSADDMKKYSYMDETVLKYYNAELLSDILTMLYNDKSESIDEFDENLVSAVVLCTINENDGTGEIKNVLNDYAEKYNFDKTKFETSLYSALANEASKTPFGSVDDIADFIKKYKKQESSGGSGSGSGGGSKGGSLTGSTSKPPLTGVELPVYEVPDDMSDASKIFSDLEENEWASEAIEDLYIKGVINGTEEGKFSPSLNVKREEFAKMLTKAFKVDLVSSEQHFDDVTPDDWCYDFVNSLYLSGAAKGISEKLFGMGENITRQDLCVMICRMADIAKGSFDNTSDLITFSDNDDIADYAKEAVVQLQRAGIISGYEDNSFRPNGFATRAEAAKIICETLVKINY